MSDSLKYHYKEQLDEFSEARAKAKLLGEETIVLTLRPAQLNRLMHLVYSRLEYFEKNPEIKGHRY